MPNGRPAPPHPRVTRGQESGPPRPTAAQLARAREWKTDLQGVADAESTGHRDQAATLRQTFLAKVGQYLSAYPPGWRRERMESITTELSYEAYGWNYIETEVASLREYRASQRRASWINLVVPFSNYAQYQAEAERTTRLIEHWETIRANRDGAVHDLAGYMALVERP